MKKYVVFILGIMVAALTWIPSVRLFLTDSSFGTWFVCLLAIVVCLAALYLQKKERSFWNICSFILGLSPLLFVLLVTVLLKFGLPFAP
ncbi:hypothetical protein [Enterococcus columbae]|uniref:DUF3902 family protein n=1 Tax=Enterococcus columbae DSM 7374 = ATCC 51263 TaxID=1121865 RepID=S0KK50_9ENTE|nr:hypothetical protein [Enterococcus columbae]EOT39596.1 hypothetical protein OMW_01896 [Enterococcus columbae DSM 7374 = ATCC 51263]EOW80123.1 hypothetical protein I568_02202 [Enterococcus columbae DSM 7374 = ATCC 51263]OJG22790.1 hypothetical protein RR47_GL000692 [Enterococcus columbae DSM 7374 = ATCC 51263]HJF19860.1 hypothetical protein [Enterococcus columbae]